MSKSPNLTRLARPPLYSHVAFYRQHPGSPADLLQRKIGPNVLDPSHPATRTPYKAFPFTKTDYIFFRAFPNAILIPNPDSSGSPDWPRIDTWKDRVERAAELRRRLDTTQLPDDYRKWVAPAILAPHPASSIPMSLYFSTSKARTHKHAVVRRRIRTKFREAINLIVTRGAHATESSEAETPGLDFNYTEVQERGDRWILPDWTYICHADPKLYLAGFSDMIPLIRTAFQKIWNIGMQLEVGWAKSEMRKHA